MLKNVSLYRFYALMNCNGSHIIVIGYTINIVLCTWISIGCRFIHSDYICFVWITDWCCISLQWIYKQVELMVGDKDN